MPSNDEGRVKVSRRGPSMGLEATTHGGRPCVAIVDRRPRWARRTVVAVVLRAHGAVRAVDHDHSELAKAAGRGNPNMAPPAASSGWAPTKSAAISLLNWCGAPGLVVHRAVGNDRRWSSSVRSSDS